MSRHLTTIILMTCALSGCATMSPEECLQANWEEVGYNDAAGGYPVSRSAEHREACAETGVSIDFELYRHGYSLGLPYYCTRETGFETADHGGDFASQCQRQQFPEYAEGFSEGNEVYLLKRELSELETLIDDRSAQSEALLTQISQLRIARDNPELSSETRREARYQLTQLESLYSELNQDLESLQRSRDALFAEISSLNAAFYRSL